MNKGQLFSFLILLTSACEYKHSVVDAVEPACTPEVAVSFAKDVHPIFESKCSFSKCHNHDNNLIPYLTNWTEIHSNVSDIPFQLQNEAMPPSSSKGGQLSTHEKALIQCWIIQGALNN